MPLSDHEQRILAEFEESLVRQDPEFAERVRTETVYRHAGRYCKWAAVTFILGVAILVAFYSVSVIVGFIGVVIMFASAVVVRAQSAPNGSGRVARSDPGQGRRAVEGRGRIERVRERRDRSPRLVPLPLPPARALSRRGASRGPLTGDRACRIRARPR